MFSFLFISAAVTDKSLDVQFTVKETHWSLYIHLADGHSTVISTNSVKNTLMQRFLGSTHFLSNPDAKGMGREIMVCDSVASIEHN